MRDEFRHIDFLIHRLARGVIYRILLSEYGIRDYLLELVRDKPIPSPRAPVFAIPDVTPRAEGAHAGQAPLEVCNIVLEAIIAGVYNI